MSKLFWGTGAVVWVAALSWFAFEAGVIGVANAVSQTRWHIRAMRAAGRSPRWLLLPVYFTLIWIDCIGYRNHGYRTLRMHGSEWRGIGDWRIRTPAHATQDLDEPCEEDQ